MATDVPDVPSRLANIWACGEHCEYTRWQALDSQKAYFYNHKTRKSQWEVPKPAEHRQWCGAPSNRSLGQDAAPSLSVATDHVLSSASLTLPCEGWRPLHEVKPLQTRELPVQQNWPSSASTAANAHVSASSSSRAAPQYVGARSLYPGSNKVSTTVPACEGIDTSEPEPEQAPGTPAKPWTIKQNVLVAAAAVLLAALLIIAYIGLKNFLFSLFVCCVALYTFHDRMLGQLASYAIGKTPKAFRWSIERISFRPRFSLGDASWSELVVVNWTWHNPDDFGHAPEPFILQIDRLTIRLRVRSVIAAIKRRESIDIDLLLVEGLRFRTYRNQDGALNLWTALDLPDDDVNVQSMINRARDVGGLEAAASQTETRNHSQKLQPMQAVESARTRQTAKYWRPEWGKRRTLKSSGKTGCFCTGSLFSSKSKDGSSNTYSSTESCTSLGSYISASDSDVETGWKEPLLPKEPTAAPLLPEGYHEYPIGDTRRRPRWGVPLRFNIKRFVLLEVDLWILDLMLLDAHDPHDETKLHVQTLDISRERLEKGDERRSGGGDLHKGGEAPGDGIHGVYLGELVWVLIAEVVPLILKQSPSRLLKNAVFAATYAAKDVGLRIGAKSLEFAYAAEKAIYDQIEMMLHGRHDHHGTMCDCRLLVHLIGGRRITITNGKRVNAYVKIELREPVMAGAGTCGELLDAAASRLRMWTKSPKWNQHFELGPVHFKQSSLRISCYHRKSGVVCHTRQVSAGSDASDDESGVDVFLGEVVLSVSDLLISSDTVESGEDKVGWFLLEGYVQKRPERRSLISRTRQPERAAPVSRGALKLGLQLVNADKLKDPPTANASKMQVSAPRASSSIIVQ